MKVKSKKFVGYVLKGETIKQTLREFRDCFEFDLAYSTLGMFNKTEAKFEEKPVIKRVITISWHDEEVK